MKIQNYLDKIRSLEPFTVPVVLTLILIVLMSTLIGCSSIETVEETNTEMTGEPVNIGLSGQIEMCEREPESVLCEDDE
mgnify:CR=1 FL=1